VDCDGCTRVTAVAIWLTGHPRRILGEHLWCDLSLDLPGCARRRATVIDNVLQERHREIEGYGVAVGIGVVLAVLEHVAVLLMGGTNALPGNGAGTRCR
jgi:hypothetical protein